MPDIEVELNSQIEHANATFDWYARTEFDIPEERDLMLNFWSGYRAGLEQAREIMRLN